MECSPTWIARCEHTINQRTRPLSGYQTRSEIIMDLENVETVLMLDLEDLPEFQSRIGTERDQAGAFSRNVCECFRQIGTARYLLYSDVDAFRQNLSESAKLRKNWSIGSLQESQFRRPQFQTSLTNTFSTRWQRAISRGQSKLPRSQRNATMIHGPKAQTLSSNAKEVKTSPNASPTP